jgi:iron-regulated transporter 1
MTIIFSRPDQFQWPVLSSCIAVFTAGGLYTIFVRSRRGHLFHLPRCIDLAERKGRPGSVRYERLENI